LALKAAPCGKDPTWVGRCVADTEHLARQASPDTAELRTGVGRHCLVQLKVACSVGRLQGFAI
jgi:hypothetical protein